MTPEQSRELLRGYLSELQTGDDDLDTLAQRLGYRPFALEMAGRYLASGFCPSVTEYGEKLDEIWDSSPMASWQEKLSSPTAQDLNCMAAFGLNWQQVDDEMARRVLLFAGYCMPRQAIPDSLLAEAAKPHARAHEEAVNTLVDLGLLAMDDPEVGPTIHPTLADYARAQEGADAILPHLAAGLNLELERNIESREQEITDLGPLLPHIRLIASMAAEAGLEIAVSLNDHLGIYLIQTKDYDGAIDAYDRALTLEEQASRPDLQKMAAYAKMRAVAFRYLGNMEGVRAGFEQAAAFQAEHHAKFHHDPDHIFVGQIHRDAGKMLEAMGDLEGARAAIERALPIYERFLERQDPRGSNHPAMADLTYRLADVLRGLENWEGAQAAYERALEIDTTVYGPEHKNVAADAAGLGRVLQAQGDLEAAQTALKQAVKVGELAHGADHLTTATYVSWYADLLKERKEFYTAYTLYRRALLILKASLPPDSQAIKTTQKNMQDMQQALKERGPRPQNTPEYREQLLREGRHAELFQVFRRMLAVSPDDPNLLYNVSLSACRSSQFAEAGDHLRRLKDQVPRDFRARAMLVQVYEALERFDERDAERDELLTLYSQQKAAPDRPTDYCRDQFTVGDTAVQAFEHFELVGDMAVRYVFYVFGAGEKKPTYTISLGSYVATNEYMRQRGTLQPDERVFHLDENRPDGHRSLGFYTGEPPYDEVKRAVQDILRQT
jgi:tetratricopeptide (TPR) repeat protein